MADDAQGQKAIDELNQAEYDGKVINVTVARPRTERPAGNRGGFHRNNNFNGERKERRYLKLRRLSHSSSASFSTPK